MLYPYLQWCPTRKSTYKVSLFKIYQKGVGWFPLHSAKYVTHYLTGNAVTYTRFLITPPDSVHGITGRSKRQSTRHLWCKSIHWRPAVFVTLCGNHCYWPGKNHAKKSLCQKTLENGCGTARHLRGNADVKVGSNDLGLNRHAVNKWYFALFRDVHRCIQ